MPQLCSAMRTRRSQSIYRYRDLLSYISASLRLIPFRIRISDSQVGLKLYHGIAKLPLGQGGGLTRTSYPRPVQRGCRSAITPLNWKDLIMLRGSQSYIFLPSCYLVHIKYTFVFVPMTLFIQPFTAINETSSLGQYIIFGSQDRLNIH